MTRIRLETIIQASIERCFDLSRSIDVHLDSMEKSNEKAIGGRVSGLIEKGETVTWRATHFFVSQTMTVKIVEMKRPDIFEDVMVKGPFKSMAHTHLFKVTEGATIMTDVFEYTVPYSWIGRLFDSLVLKSYMKRLLQQRNDTIRSLAENT
ncbi:MAG: SRPBCC family protein [Chryseolinea sp.]